ncbi:DC-STAMP domain-containing protein 2-like [Teleopsis dalmanni]|uniref:DC-STAMP domain-containing protein 2-like n=1 Tax=Teleopsis dalmanni TaxID=139649 RepID=UPI0018CFEA27|nr:DC-STAMP domain-containing protein 2-like [Teleopsis dalmanni]
MVKKDKNKNKKENTTTKEVKKEEVNNEKELQENGTDNNKENKSKDNDELNKIDENNDNNVKEEGKNSKDEKKKAKQDTKLEKTKIKNDNKEKDKNEKEAKKVKKKKHSKQQSIDNTTQKNDKLNETQKSNDEENEKIYTKAEQNKSDDNEKEEKEKESNAKKKKKKTNKLIRYIRRLPMKLVISIMICGYLVGVAITVLLFFLSVQSKTNEKFKNMWIFCTIVTFIMLVLCYSRHVRCVVVLTLPVIFSAKGRSLVIALAFILAATGPIRNILKNVEVLADSLTCGQNQLREALTNMLDILKRPLVAVKEAIQKAMAEVRKVMERVKLVLERIQSILMLLLAGIKNAYNWLNSLVSVCNKEFGTPFDRCIKIADDAMADCRDKLGVLDTLCNFTELFRMLCYTVKVIDVICVFVDFFSDQIINSILERLKQFSEEIKNMFDVSITFEHDFYFKTESSNDLKTVSKRVVKEIRSRMNPIFLAMGFLDIIGIILFFFIFIKAIYFRYKYLNNVRYKNVYITKDFIEIDEKRKEQKSKDRALPLDVLEMPIYVKIFNFQLTANEILNISHSIVFLFITTMQLTIICATDYSFYWCLDLIAYYGDIEADLEVPPYITVDVKGGGVAGDMYGGIVHAFEPNTQNYTIDSTSCLPRAKIPNFRRYQLIGLLCVMAWIMLFTQPYGLRLRHLVMRYYYPEVSQRRALWLYNHILLKRETIFKLARRKVRTKLLNDKVSDNFTFMDWLRVKAESYICCSLLVRLLCGKRKVDLCLICAKTLQGSDKVKCPKFQCPGLYCKKCYTSSNSSCCICQSPFECGDQSDLSQEVDSSELDEVHVPESDPICKINH